jgi:hypothetical protein
MTDRLHVGMLSKVAAWIASAAARRVELRHDLVFPLAVAARAAVLARRRTCGKGSRSYQACCSRWFGASSLLLMLTYLLPLAEASQRTNQRWLTPSHTRLRLEVPGWVGHTLSKHISSVHA